MNTKLIGYAAAIFAALGVVNAPDAIASPAYTVGGVVTGLVSGQSVVLLNNGGDAITASANGTFTFPSPVSTGTSYLVTIGTQPVDETCFTANAIGVVEADNIINISVTCVPNTYFIGGTVSGLGSGKSLVLQNNGGDATTVSANGGFFFPTDVPSGTGYSVTVSTQPANQQCSVTNGSGVVNGVTVSNIGISCINTFSIGGVLSGLASGKSVILRNNGSDTLILSSNGNFIFATQLTAGASYSIGIVIQPTGQTCLVANGSGTATTNVTNVNVSCSATYTVAGSISGLTASGLVLRLNASSLIIANGATSFKFATALTDTSPYSVSVGVQPIGMSCSVNYGTGVINAANITNVAVACNKTYSVGGTISGLTVSGLILKLNGGANKIVSSGSTSFTFSTALISGTSYAVTIQQQPTGWTCLLFNASGTIVSSNVTAVSLSCSPNTYTIGGGVVGLGAGNTLILKNNGGNSLLVSTNGIFSFTNPMTSGSSYLVSIAFQPTGQTCVLQNASGTVISTNVSNVSVACGPFTVSGTISGLTTSGLVLNLNGTNNLTVAANATSFAFSATLNGGQNYAVTVGGQPAGLGCEVVNGTGVVVNTNINTVSVTCVPTAPPAAPLPTVGYTNTSNQVIISWSSDPYVSYFKVSKDPTGSSGYSPICQANSPTDTTCLDVYGKLSDFISARYIVTACNQYLCTDSLPFSAFTLQAIQYIKASNAETFDCLAGSASTVIQTACSSNGSRKPIAVSEDGNTLAVGASGEDSSATGINGDQSDNNTLNAGAVYVFTRNGSTWNQQAYVKASNTEANDVFGAAVALSADGSTLAVGATGEDSSATGINGDQSDNSAASAGAVYVFTRSGSAWNQQAYVKASNAEASDAFGVTVTLSADGSTLAVGATGEASGATGINGDPLDNSAASAGAVYVFTRNGSAWIQDAYVKASNTGAGDSFGSNIAMSTDGSTLAVGAAGEDSSATVINGDQSDNSAASAGAVYVFTRSGGTWGQQAYVKASNAEASDAFGVTVTLSADGSTLAVGASNEASSATGINGDQSDNSAASAGAVYVFTRGGSTWAQQAYVKASNTQLSDFFGRNVTLSGDGNVLAVSASGEDGNSTGVNGDQLNNGASNAGAVYIFTRNSSTWVQQGYVKASNTQAGDGFGSGVALSADGGTLVVGAANEDSSATGINGDQLNNNASATGALYVY